jgi:hypothetical protein
MKRSRITGNLCTFKEVKAEGSIQSIFNVWYEFTDVYVKDSNLKPDGALKYDQEKLKNIFIILYLISIIHNVNTIFQSSF